MVLRSLSLVASSLTLDPRRTGTTGDDHNHKSNDQHKQNLLPSEPKRSSTRTKSDPGLLRSLKNKLNSGVNICGNRRSRSSSSIEQEGKQITSISTETEDIIKNPMMLSESLKSCTIESFKSCTNGEELQEGNSKLVSSTLEQVSQDTRPTLLEMEGDFNSGLSSTLEQISQDTPKLLEMEGDSKKPTLLEMEQDTRPTYPNIGNGTLEQVSGQDTTSTLLETEGKINLNPLHSLQVEGKWTVSTKKDYKNPNTDFASSSSSSSSSLSEIVEKNNSGSEWIVLTESTKNNNSATTSTNSFPSKSGNFSSKKFWIEEIYHDIVDKSDDILSEDFKKTPSP